MVLSFTILTLIISKKYMLLSRGWPMWCSNNSPGPIDLRSPVRHYNIISARSDRLAYREKLYWYSFRISSRKINVRKFLSPTNFSKRNSTCRKKEFTFCEFSSGKFQELSAYKFHYLQYYPFLLSTSIVSELISQWQNILHFDRNK